MQWIRKSGCYKKIERGGVMRGLLLLLAFVAGCAPSAKELMKQSFAADPPVVIENELDGSRLYKTRNIALDAQYGGSQLSSLVMVIALAADRPAPEAPEGGGGIMKFRSVAAEQRFLAERSLVLTVGGLTRDLGPCAYEIGLSKEKGVVESLTAFVPMDLVRQMARTDTVKGTIGPLPFLLTPAELAPVSALIDTTMTR